MQKQSHRHLREEDRKIIYRMRKAGKTQQEIADMLGVSQGTICKELRRNRGQRGYRPRQAQMKALERKDGKAPRRRIIQGEIALRVEERLRCKDSPEQISGAMKLTGVRLSHETIYRHVIADKRVGGDLWCNLRINGKRRYRHRVKGSRSKIPDRKGIEERPAVVARRERYGDWEVDLVAGSQGSGYLLSLYERKSRLGITGSTPSPMTTGLSLPNTEGSKRRLMRLVIFADPITAGRRVALKTSMVWCVSTFRRVTTCA